MLGDGKVLLSWDQVRGLDRKGMTIASHSRHHPFLTRVWGPRLTDEVSGSKRILEKFLGHPVRYFAYPFGQYDARVVQAVRDAGYEAARGTWDGTRHRPADLLVLKAVYASEDHAAFVRDVAR
jgi:peptidoglycan/xylan/chitin deacetylase (PgdA/CDA1 family)